ncbi:isochorismatase family protein [Peptoniphilus sp. KCTC 25270]|uniref:isochorismatase family protein n=1 Tax=Peptoniphilus sp. KCTC 25270 TaxID=2897414 RepID=UPI001E4C7B3D|nr:isochorismatase family protein [Peptoniphilus sp. KCTC 25270]MCD1147227.1 isochorismatase family protein [Peptoniphilus sp. KCTC 25270]
MKHYLKREETLFLQIDIQDSLAGAMCDTEGVLKNANILAESAEVMGIETIFTTQYKKGLGEFNEMIRTAVSKGYDLDKKSFSCMLNEEFRNLLEELSPKSIVVTGIEAHICVLLTVRDLLKEGYEVYVAADAVSSRNPSHALYALEEMREMGAVIRPTESILFDLNSVSGTDEFKQIQKLIK